MKRSPEDLFRGWKPTPAPNHLEEIVMSAVQETVVSRQRTLVDRLWDSRALRYGWVAAATALMALNLSLPTPAGPEPGRTVKASEEAEFDPVLASLLEDRVPTKNTWADQGDVVRVLLGETQEVAADATSSGGRS